MNQIILATEKDLSWPVNPTKFNKTTNNPKENNYKNISTKVIGWRNNMIGLFEEYCSQFSNFQALENSDLLMDRNELEIELENEGD